MRPPRLSDLQAWMRWVVTDPRGVDPALSAPIPEDASPRERFEEPKPRLAEWISDEGLLGRVDRLSVYAEGYCSRLLEASEEAFPSLMAFLGEERFRHFVAHYLLHYPSRDANVSEIWCHAATYLAEQGANAAAADLALLEWKRIEAFYADATRTIPISDLQALGGAESERISFGLASSVRLVRTRWNSQELLEGSESEARPFEGCVLVWRTGGEAHSRRLDPDEAKILEKIAAGVRLGELLESISEEEAAQLNVWLSNWIQQEVVDSVCLN